MPELTIAILMGGESKRMGRDKAFVKWKGKTFLEHLYQELSFYNKNIVLSVNNDQYLKLKNSYTCILDEEPKKGPLGGIYSVLNQLESDVIFFAVDMPESYPLYEPLVKREGNVCFTLNNKIQSLPLKLSSNTKGEVFLNIQNNNLKLKSYIESIKCNIIEVQGNKCLLNVNNFCILNV